MDMFDLFFQSKAFAVVGASKDRAKYGNKVLRCYMQNNLKVYPVHPTEKEIEGLVSVQSVLELPEDVKSISVVTPPPITENIVKQAIEKGIQNIWMQPGAQSQLAIELCQKAGINVIGDGSCVLVRLGFHDR